MKAEGNKVEQAISKALSKESLELVSSTESKETGVFDVTAHHLEPVASGHGTLYVPVPVNLKVYLDKQYRVKKIARQDLAPETLAEARHFGKTLVDNKQVTLPGQPNPNSTHVIVVNASGQQVIRRKRFSSF